MAPADRMPPDSMNTSAIPSLQRFWQQVAAAPHAYDFYVLLRWLDARAGMPVRMGRAIHPGDEPLRIGHRPWLRPIRHLKDLKAGRRVCRFIASACSVQTVRCRCI
jgi:predicted component of type VI protein secretion system